MWERGWALLAWKLGSKSLVVDEGVVLSGVVDGSLGVYRTIKGGRNNKYTAMIAIQITDIAQWYTNGVLLQCYPLQTNRKFIQIFTGFGDLPDRRTGGGRIVFVVL